LSKAPDRIALPILPAFLRSVHARHMRNKDFLKSL
jgi:hypothetical protein